MDSKNNPHNALSPWDEEAIKQGKAIKAQEDAFYAGGGATGSYNGPKWVSSSDQLNEAVNGLPPLEPRLDINNNISKDWDASGKFIGTHDKPLSKVYKPEDYNQDHLRAVMGEYGFNSLDASAGFSGRVLGNTPGKESSIDMPSRFNPNGASLSDLAKANMPLGQLTGVPSTLISDANDPLYGGYREYTVTDPMGGGRAEAIKAAQNIPEENPVPLDKGAPNSSSTVKEWNDFYDDMDRNQEAEEFAAWQANNVSTTEETDNYFPTAAEIEEELQNGDYSEEEFDQALRSWTEVLHTRKFSPATKGTNRQAIGTGYPPQEQQGTSSGFNLNSAYGDGRYVPQPGIPQRSTFGQQWPQPQPDMYFPSVYGQQGGFQGQIMRPGTVQGGQSHPTSPPSWGGSNMPPLQYFPDGTSYYNFGQK